MSAETLKKMLLAGLFSLPMLLAGNWGHTQYESSPKTAAPAVPGADQVKATQGGGLVTFEAKLVQPTVKAKSKTATVEVSVAATHLVDPDTTNGKPAPGQHHLHYQLDNGPVIATTATKLSFHELSPGQHTIKVSLAENDHTLVGRENVLTITIP